MCVAHDEATTRYERKSTAPTTAAAAGGAVSSRSASVPASLPRRPSGDRVPRRRRTLPGLRRTGGTRDGQPRRRRAAPRAREGCLRPCPRKPTGTRLVRDGRCSACAAPRRGAGRSPGRLLANALAGVVMKRRRMKTKRTQRPSRRRAVRRPVFILQTMPRHGISCVSCGAFVSVEELTIESAGDVSPALHSRIIRNQRTRVSFSARPLLLGYGVGPFIIPRASRRKGRR